MSTADQLKTDKGDRRLTIEAQDLTDLEWCHEANREDEVFFGAPKPRDVL
jgi:hypothetical protein